MMPARSDKATPDLFAWEPPQVVPMFSERQINAKILRDRIALAVAVTLKEAAMPRDRIALCMSDWMGEEISLDMLNAYASQARKEHTISANRLAALCAVTGDMRPMQLLLQPSDFVAIPKKWLWAIEDAKLGEQEEEIRLRRKVARRGWNR